VLGPSSWGRFLFAPRTNPWPAERHSKPGADGRLKAENLAFSAGKNIGDAITVTEDILVSNGAYGALLTTMPAVFGSGAVPAVIGELEYYARVSASFRLQ